MLTSNNKIISNEFAKHYAGLGTRYAKIVHDKRDPNIDYNILPKLKPIKENIFLHPTNSIEVARIVSELKTKKSFGLDDISNVILKGIIGSIKYQLADLINRTMTIGIFPSIFKTALVRPLYKKGDKREISNYRPISLLSCVSKIFEKVLLNRLVKFFTKHNILYEGQYGFRKNRSTTDACLDLVGNVISNLEDNNYVVAVFLDMSKFLTQYHQKSYLTNSTSMELEG